jgi:hypothetical protein
VMNERQHCFTDLFSTFQHNFSIYECLKCTLFSISWWWCVFYHKYVTILFPLSLNTKQTFCYTLVMFHTVNHYQKLHIVHVYSSFNGYLNFYCWKVKAQFFLRCINSWENYINCLNLYWKYNACYSIKGRVANGTERLLASQEVLCCMQLGRWHMTPWEELAFLYFLIVLWSCLINFIAQKCMY